MTNHGVLPQSAARAESTAEERAFGLHEMFSSLTDEKGIIRSGNDVFVRVSGYSREDMIGQPHNLVRHPDMPRVVFKMLWDSLNAGHAIGAYVKNRAADGRYYWVLATAMPTPGGYLSIRIKPSTPYFDVARGLYAELREIERRIEGTGGLQRKEAMEASGQRLAEALRTAGYPGYGAFMRAAVLAEVRARDEHLRQRGPASAAATGDAAGTLHTAIANLAVQNERLSRLVLQLDDYYNANFALAEDATFVRKLAEEVQLFALNAIIAASKANGRDGAAISAVAALLRAQSQSSSDGFATLGDTIASLVTSLDQMLFPVATARLQAEALHVSLMELVDPDAAAQTGADALAIQRSISAGLGDLESWLVEFSGRLRALHSNIAALRRSLTIMRDLGLNGQIESARLEDADQFTTLFSTVRDQVALASRKLDTLATTAGSSFVVDAQPLAGLRAAVDAAGAALHEAPSSLVA